MIGSNVTNMTFPVCTIFEPTVYEGRQCYEAKFGTFQGRQALKGKKNGLVLLINVKLKAERSYNIKASDKVKKLTCMRFTLEKLITGQEKIRLRTRIWHASTLAPLLLLQKMDLATMC